MAILNLFLNAINEANKYRLLYNMIHISNSLKLYYNNILDKIDVQCTRDRMNVFFFLSLARL